MKHTAIAASLLFLLAHAPPSLGAIIVTPQGGNVWVQARNTFGTWNGKENPSPSLSDSLNVDAPSHPLDGGKTTAAAKWTISSYGANLSVNLFGFRGYSLASSAGQVNFSITASGPLRYRGWIGGIGEVEGVGNPFPHGLSWRVPDVHEYYATSERRLATSILWTDEADFPGEEPNNPLIASTFEVEEKPKFPDQHEPGTDLTDDEIAATNLTSLPVMGTYGYDDPVYVQFPEHSLPIGPTHPLFYYSKNAFTSLTIPSMSEGRSAAADYAISVQGQTYTITGGTTVDLAALGVTDVNLIRLWPLNEGDPIPQVLGLTFASQGVTDLWQGIIVPEPSTFVLALCAGVGLLATRRCRPRGSNVAGDFQQMAMPSLFKWLAAVAIALAYSPAMGQGPCTTVCPDGVLPLRTTTEDGEGGAFNLAVTKSSLWPVGATINVRFLNGTPQQQRFVEEVARKWNGLGNFQLTFQASGPPDIRVGFNWKGDATSWSALGIDGRAAPSADPTMNFGWLDNGVVLHEFGHALGCVHEHLRPANGIPWDRPKAYEYYLRNNPRWDRAVVDHNVFNVLDRRSLYMSGRFDRSSIMAYHIPNEITIGNYEIPWNDALSQSDRDFIQKVYPFADDGRLKRFRERIDAAVNWNDGKAYLFRGNEYVRVNTAEFPDNTVDAAYPKKITGRRWPGWDEARFTNGIDAAVSWNVPGEEPVAYFFKGDQYIKVHMKAWPENRMFDGYPKRITDRLWPGWEKARFTNGIDAAVSWNVPGEEPVAYFFKGDQYIKVHMKAWPENKMFDGYPKKITDRLWPGWEKAGFTNGIDAAVEWPTGKAYVSRGSQYIRLNVKPYPMNIMDGGYPKKSDRLIHYLGGPNAR